jgi:hypothetical protein
MSGRRYSCENKRRALLLEQPGQTLNGIKFLEVIDNVNQPPAVRQRHLVLHLFRPAVLVKENFRFEGGIRVRPVRLSADPKVDVNDQTIILLEVEQPGDFSLYTLHLVKSQDDPSPPANFDPQLSEILFSFKIECPDDLDCKPIEYQVNSDQLPKPVIDYLARDYATFRRLILDRLSVTLPDWKERNPADLMVVIVEALAYAADHLSYLQDAVASEMYLDTSRLRSSVRRHARLLDYAMHQGCNARVWVSFEAGEVLFLPEGLPFLTEPSQDEVAVLLQGKTGLSGEETDLAIQAGSQVFELMTGGVVFPANNQMAFYTWLDENCCLPRGATRATLKDAPDPAKRILLRVGDVVIFEEIQTTSGPSGLEKRHPVRLTKVVPQAEPAVLVTQAALDALSQDGLTPAEITTLTGIGQPLLHKPIKESEFYTQVKIQLGAVDEKRLRPKLKRRLRALYRVPGPALTDPLSNQPIVEIEWGLEDAIPFQMCLSSSSSGKLTENMSIALGNVLPADHGWSIPAEPLEKMPPNRAYRPRLKERPLVFSNSYQAFKDQSSQPIPAVEFMRQDASQALPALHLIEEGGETWHPQGDLLNSGRFAREFVVEVEEDGQAVLRFAQPGVGRPPQDGMQALYRIAEPLPGNIGAESLRYYGAASSTELVSLQSLLRLRNPLPAAGGKNPESLVEVKNYAPHAFRRQERAITSQDYARMAEHHPDAQKAIATRRWTGSWYTQFISVDRKEGLPIDSAFENDLRNFLERFRLAGQDVEVNTPDFVPLDIEINICVNPGFFPGVVHADLLAVFSNRELAGGRKGFFHPDHFTFGQPLYLSQVISTAMAVPGVDWVEVVRFRSWTGQDDLAIQAGYLPVNRLEIIQVENDRNFPEFGRIVFNLRERNEVNP